MSLKVIGTITFGPLNRIENTWIIENYKIECVEIGALAGPKEYDVRVNKIWIPKILYQIVDEESFKDQYCYLANEKCKIEFESSGLIFDLCSGKVVK